MCIKSISDLKGCVLICFEGIVFYPSEFKNKLIILVEEKELIFPSYIMPVKCQNYINEILGTKWYVRKPACVTLFRAQHFEKIA